MTKTLTSQTVFFVAVLLLLYRCFADDGSGSGDNEGGADSTKVSSIARCEPAKYRDACSIIRSSTNFQIVVSNESLIILQHVSKVIENKSNKCSRFISFFLCFYFFRECELSNVSNPSSGSQLIICRDKCAGVTELYQECVISGDNLETIAENSDSQAVHKFVSKAMGFMCSDPKTYAIAGVPISNTSCNDMSYIESLLSNAGPSVNNDVSAAVRRGVAIGIPLVVITLIAAVVTLTVAVHKLRRSKKTLQRRLTERELIECQLRREQSLNMENSIEDMQLSSEEHIYYVERFDRGVIAFDQLQMAEAIGEGTFGVVYKAMLVEESSTQPVAVKTARSLSSKQELHSLLKESLLMKRFDHPNIVGLLGVCFDTPDGYPYLILPFMANGNIRDYLKDKRVHPTNTTALPDDMSVKTLVSMCVDIAKGMEYLSSNKFLHRDLAARNCMLDKEGAVRVGDFGLARDVYSHLYYRADKHSKVPVKWSAPEMLNDGLCTEKSDVWSYGVVCWEVFSLGSTPYPGVTNYDIPQYLVSGERLKKPPLCPQDMFVIMKSCWKIRPEERPHFKHLVDIISLS